MAHTKTGGSTTLGRDSHAQRLGPKVTHGQKIASGVVLVRQRGTKFRPGKNVKRGGGDTLYAIKSGIADFKTKKIMNFDGKLRTKTVISVI